MTGIASPPEKLRCPSCRDALIGGSATQIECVGCGAHYPVFDGLPWVYRDVASSRGQWASKLQLLQGEIIAELRELDRFLEQAPPMTSTRERLTRLRAGSERLGTQIFALLAPFAFAESEIASGIPRDRIPSKQHFSSYLETVFRDWCWGEEEVRETLALVEPLLGDERSGRHVLILGGGAGRLAYELSLLGDWGSIVQLDINPLLSRIASLIVRGETIELAEMPRLPIGLEHVAVDQTLSRPAAAPSAPLHFLLGDVFAPPFAAESFDLLVTPWFVDILPESFGAVARRLNALLAPGGRWINFGPLSFESLPTSERYTREEMEEALGGAGMDIESSALRRVSYLHSPHAMPRRAEEIFVFAASRRERASIDHEFAYYPSWMTDPEQSVPLLPAFEQMRNDRVFDVEILGRIDGRASIREIVGSLSSQYSLPVDRCENAVNRFFSKFLETEPGETS